MCGTFLYVVPGRHRIIQGKRMGQIRKQGGTKKETSFGGAKPQRCLFFFRSFYGLLKMQLRQRSKNNQALTDL